MPQAKKKRSWLNRLRAWLNPKKPTESEAAAEAPRKVLSIVYLPQSVSCMGDHVRMSIPQDFGVYTNVPRQVVLHGARCGLMLTIAAILFSGMLQRCTPQTLIDSFLRQGREISMIRFEHDFLRYSPRISAHYRTGTEESVLVLVQKRRDVFSLLFTGNVKPNLSVIETMLSTLELN